MQSNEHSNHPDHSDQAAQNARNTDQQCESGRVSVYEPSDDSGNSGNLDHAQAIDSSLFEHYEPRRPSIIVSQLVSQRRALRDSEAAEAAAIILDGVEPPEFDFDEQSAQIPYADLHGSTKTLLGSKPVHIRVQRLSPMKRLVSPGAQFVYALLIISTLAGIIGLAATIESPTLVLIAGIASPLLLPICVWKWIRWLDSSPYYYRLLTSLGEDARNLMGYRLLWKKGR